jgi:hypothetical protein
MALTENQIKLVLNRLAEMQINPVCPLCRKNDWEPDGIAAIPTLNEKGEIDISCVIPTVLMCCNYCGYTYQLSAVKIGLSP